MPPLLPFRFVAVLLVLSAAIPVGMAAVYGEPLLASATDAALLLALAAFVGLAAKLLWQGERWVAWALLALQGPMLLLNGAVALPPFRDTLSIDWIGVGANLSLAVLLAIGLWTTRPDAHGDLSAFDEEA